MNGKTIAQIAEEIGVTKQAIQKQIKKEPLKTVLKICMTKKGRTSYINTDGEKLIKAEYGIKVINSDNQDKDIKTAINTDKKITIDNQKKSVKNDVKIPIKSIVNEKPKILKNNNTDRKKSIPTIEKIAEKPKTAEIKKELPTTSSQKIKKEATTELKKPQNIYELLGVSLTSTQEEIDLFLLKANYNFFDSLCEDYNPTEKQKAMDILAYPEKRREYDIKNGFKEK